jgi:hypothetical protein
MGLNYFNFIAYTSPLSDSANAAIKKLSILNHTLNPLRQMHFDHYRWAV